MGRLMKLNLMLEKYQKTLNNVDKDPTIKQEEKEGVKRLLLKNIAWIKEELNYDLRNI